LEFFKSLGSREIFDNTGRVHHAWSKEEFIKIITTYTQGQDTGGQKIASNRAKGGLKPQKLTIVLVIDFCLIHALGMGSDDR